MFKNQKIMGIVGGCAALISASFTVGIFVLLKILPALLGGGSFSGIIGGMLDVISLSHSLLISFWLFVLGIAMLVMAFMNKKNFIPSIPIALLWVLDVLWFVILTFFYITNGFGGGSLFVAYIITLLPPIVSILSFFLSLALTLCATVNAISKKVTFVNKVWFIPAILHLLAGIISVLTYVISQILIFNSYRIEIDTNHLVALVLNALINFIPYFTTAVALFFIGRWAVIKEVSATVAPSKTAVCECEREAEEATEKAQDNSTYEDVKPEAVQKAAPETVKPTETQNATPKAVHTDNGTGTVIDGTATIASQLRQYKAMFDEGLITSEEFEAKRRQLLNLR